MIAELYQSRDNDVDEQFDPEGEPPQGFGEEGTRYHYYDNNELDDEQYEREDEDLDEVGCVRLHITCCLR